MMMMNKTTKYSICVQGTREDWFFNGKFIDGDDASFSFYDEKNNCEYTIMW